jgi:carboxypeptidase A2
LTVFFLFFFNYHYHSFFALSWKSSESGSSSDKCSEIYAGPSPFSEPSCDVISKYATELNADGSMVAYVTLHSYGQLWMCPYGWTSQHPDTYDELVGYQYKISNAISQ